MYRLLGYGLCMAAALFGAAPDTSAAPPTGSGATGGSCYDACAAKCEKPSEKGKTACKQFCQQDCFVKGAAPAPAAMAVQASSACDAVFARLRNAPSVGVWWTTNYFAKGIRFMGITAIELRARDADLVGQGRRFKFTLGADGLIERRLEASPGAGVETVTLRIRADGKIMFNDMYGPYTPVCWSDRFAGVHSGDSIETFNFKLP